MKKLQKLIFNVTKDLSKKGYEPNEYELYAEKHEGKVYVAAFSGTKEEPKAFGSGDTEKYVSENNSKKGFREEIDRDGSDIAENGKYINHHKIIRDMELLNNQKQELKDLLSPIKTKKQKGYGR